MHRPELPNRAARRARGPQLVRNPVTGRILPCCWADCERPGDNRIQLTSYLGKDPKTGEPRGAVYIFCSERHKAYYVASRTQTATHGNLPTGSRGLLGPDGQPL